MGLSTILGSLQMPKKSWIYSSENWIGDRVKGVCEESLTILSSF